MSLGKPPRFKNCEECDGDGVVECEECDGQGVSWGETCENCEGDGMVECYHCDGIGIVPDDSPEGEEYETD